MQMYYPHLSSVEFGHYIYIYIYIMSIEVLKSQISVAKFREETFNPHAYTHMYIYLHILRHD